MAGPTDLSETQKIEGFRLPFSASSVGRRRSARNFSLLSLLAASRTRSSPLCRFPGTVSGASQALTCPTVARFCSAASSELCRCTTPRRRSWRSYRSSPRPRHARVFACARCLPSGPPDAVGSPQRGISELNTQPADPLSNASLAASRPPSHGSGPGWFAIPSPYHSFIRYSMPVYPGAIQAMPHTFCREGLWGGFQTVPDPPWTRFRGKI